MTKTSTPPAFLTGLQENDATKVLKALDAVKKKGDHRAVMPMLYLLLEREEVEITAKVTDILNTIKDKKAVPELFLALEEDELRATRKNILTAIWQSGLEVGDRLAHLVEVAIDGDFEEAFESVTIIENQIGPFPEDQLTDAIIALRSHLQDAPEDERTALLEGILSDLEKGSENQP